VLGVKPVPDLGVLAPRPHDLRLVLPRRPKELLSAFCGWGASPDLAAVCGLGQDAFYEGGGSECSAEESLPEGLP